MIIEAEEKEKKGRKKERTELKESNCAHIWVGHSALQNILEAGHTLQSLAGEIEHERGMPKTGAGIKDVVILRTVASRMLFVNAEQ